MFILSDDIAAVELTGMIFVKMTDKFVVWGVLSFRTLCDTIYLLDFILLSL